jgi:hypothetical protein
VSPLDQPLGLLLVIAGLLIAWRTELRHWWADRKRGHQ